MPIRASSIGLIAIGPMLVLGVPGTHRTSAAACEPIVKTEGYDASVVKCDLGSGIELVAWLNQATIGSPIWLVLQAEDWDGRPPAGWSEAGLFIGAPAAHDLTMCELPDGPLILWQSIGRSGSILSCAFVRRAAAGVTTPEQVVVSQVATLPPNVGIAGAAPAGRCQARLFLAGGGNDGFGIQVLNLRVDPAGSVAVDDTLRLGVRRSAFVRGVAPGDDSSCFVAYTELPAPGDAYDCAETDTVRLLKLSAGALTNAVVWDEKIIFQAPRCGQLGAHRDGAGGCFIAWQSPSTDSLVGPTVRVLRVGADGQPVTTWPRDGVRPFTVGPESYQELVSISASPGSHKAFIVGRDGLEPSVACLGPSGASATGWPAGGVPLGTQFGGATVGEISLAPLLDSGQCSIAWSERPPIAGQFNVYLSKLPLPAGTARLLPETAQLICPSSLNSGNPAISRQTDDVVRITWDTYPVTLGPGDVNYGRVDLATGTVNPVPQVDFETLGVDSRGVTIRLRMAGALDVPVELLVASDDEAFPSSGIRLEGGSGPEPITIRVSPPGNARLLRFAAVAVTSDRRQFPVGDTASINLVSPALRIQASSVITGREARIVLLGSYRGAVELVLFDVAGRRVSSRHVVKVDESAYVPMSAPASPGLYLLRALAGSNECHARLIWQRVH